MKSDIHYIHQMFDIGIGPCTKRKAKTGKGKKCSGQTGTWTQDLPNTSGMLFQLSYHATYQAQYATFLPYFFSIQLPWIKTIRFYSGTNLLVDNFPGSQATNVTGKGKNAVTKLGLKIGTFPILAGRSTNWATGPLFKPCPLQRGIQHIHVCQMFDVGTRVFMKWKAISNTYVKCLIYMY